MIRRYESAVSNMIDSKRATTGSEASPSYGSGGSGLSPVCECHLGAIRSAGHRDLRLQLALFAFMLFWYGTILWFSPFPALPIEKTFNSMLDHLLRGQFDVDPQIVGVEGYLRNGHVYAYWGIWCALLRLPLWIFHRMNTDVTSFSCLAAVCLAAMAKVRTVLLLRQFGAQDQSARYATNLMLAYIVLGGSETGYLRACIYQEVVFWGATFGAIFVYFAIKGLISQQFDSGTLNWMALCAGLALLARPSTGIGLVLAFGLLLLVLVLQPGTKVAEGHRLAIKQSSQAFFSRRIFVPLVILAVCIVAAGAVNYFRWGTATTFADLRLWIGNKEWPDRISREATYGLFNFARIPFGLVYYFFPVWTVKTRSGQLLFEQTQTRLFDDVELPWSSFLLTDLLPLCFIIFLVIALWRHRTRGLPAVSQWAAIAVGLSTPCILMLTAISMTYRYRMEFYPEIDFLAFLGLYVILTDEAMRARFAQIRVWMEGALIISVAASLAALFLYWAAPFGPARDLIHRGIVHGRPFVL